MNGSPDGDKRHQDHDANDGVLAAADKRAVAEDAQNLQEDQDDRELERDPNATIILITKPR